MARPNERGLCRVTLVRRVTLRRGTGGAAAGATRVGASSAGVRGGAAGAGARPRISAESGLRVGLGAGRRLTGASGWLPATPGPPRPRLAASAATSAAVRRAPACGRTVSALALGDRAGTGRNPLVGRWPSFQWRRRARCGIPGAGPDRLVVDVGRGAVQRGRRGAAPCPRTPRRHRNGAARAGSTRRAGRPPVGGRGVPPVSPVRSAGPGTCGRVPWVVGAGRAGPRCRSGGGPKVPWGVRSRSSTGLTPHLLAVAWPHGRRDHGTVS